MLTKKKINQVIQGMHFIRKTLNIKGGNFVLEIVGDKRRSTAVALNNSAMFAPGVKTMGNIAYFADDASPAVYEISKTVYGTAFNSVIKPPMNLTPGEWLVQVLIHAHKLSVGNRGKKNAILKTTMDFLDEMTDPVIQKYIDVCQKRAQRATSESSLPGVHETAELFNKVNALFDVIPANTCIDAVTHASPGYSALVPKIIDDQLVTETIHTDSNQTINAIELFDNLESVSGYMVDQDLWQRAKRHYGGGFIADAMCAVLLAFAKAPMISANHIQAIEFLKTKLGSAARPTRDQVVEVVDALSEHFADDWKPVKEDFMKMVDKLFKDNEKPTTSFDVEAKEFNLIRPYLKLVEKIQSHEWGYDGLDPEWLTVKNKVGVYCNQIGTITVLAGSVPVRIPLPAVMEFYGDIYTKQVSRDIISRELYNQIQVTQCFSDALQALLNGGQIDSDNLRHIAVTGKQMVKPGVKDEKGNVVFTYVEFAELCKEFGQIEIVGDGGSTSICVMETFDALGNKFADDVYPLLKTLPLASQANKKIVADYLQKILVGHDHNARLLRSIIGVQKDRVESDYGRMTPGLEEFDQSLDILCEQLIKVRIWRGPNSVLVSLPVLKKKLGLRFSKIIFDSLDSFEGVMRCCEFGFAEHIAKCMQASLLAGHVFWDEFVDCAVGGGGVISTPVKVDIGTDRVVGGGYPIGGYIDPAVPTSNELWCLTEIFRATDAIDLYIDHHVIKVDLPSLLVLCGDTLLGVALNKIIKPSDVHGQDRDYIRDYATRVVQFAADTNRIPVHMAIICSKSVKISIAESLNKGKPEMALNKETLNTPVPDRIDATDAEVEHAKQMDVLANLFSQVQTVKLNSHGAVFNIDPRVLYRCFPDLIESFVSENCDRPSIVIGHPDNYIQKILQGMINNSKLMVADIMDAMAHVAGVPPVLHSTRVNERPVAADEVRDAFEQAMSQRLLVNIEGIYYNFNPMVLFTKCESAIRDAASAITWAGTNMDVNNPMFAVSLVQTMISKSLLTKQNILDADGVPSVVGTTVVNTGNVGEFNRMSAEEKAKDVAFDKALFEAFDHANGSGLLLKAEGKHYDFKPTVLLCANAKVITEAAKSIGPNVEKTVQYVGSLLQGLVDCGDLTKQNILNAGGTPHTINNVVKMNPSQGGKTGWDLNANPDFQGDGNGLDPKKMNFPDMGADQAIDRTLDVLFPVMSGPNTDDFLAARQSASILAKQIADGKYVKASLASLLQLVCAVRPVQDSKSMSSDTTKLLNTVFNDSLTTTSEPYLRAMTVINSENSVTRDDALRHLLGLISKHYLVKGEANVTADGNSKREHVKQDVLQLPHTIGELLAHVYIGGSSEWLEAGLKVVSALNHQDVESSLIGILRLARDRIESVRSGHVERYSETAEKTLQTHCDVQLETIFGADTSKLEAAKQLMIEIYRGHDRIKNFGSLFKVVNDRLSQVIVETHHQALAGKEEGNSMEQNQTGELHTPSKDLLDHVKTRLSTIFGNDNGYLSQAQHKANVVLCRNKHSDSAFLDLLDLVIYHAVVRNDLGKVDIKKKPDLPSQSPIEEHLKQIAAAQNKMFEELQKRNAADLASPFRLGGQPMQFPPLFPAPRNFEYVGHPFFNNGGQHAYGAGQGYVPNSNLQVFWQNKYTVCINGVDYEFGVQDAQALVGLDGLNFNNLLRGVGVYEWSHMFMPNVFGSPVSHTSVSMTIHTALENLRCSNARGYHSLLASLKPIQKIKFDGAEKDYIITYKDVDYHIQQKHFTPGLSSLVVAVLCKYGVTRISQLFEPHIYNDENRRSNVRQTIESAVAQLAGSMDAALPWLSTLPKDLFKEKKGTIDPNIAYLVNDKGYNYQFGSSHLVGNFGASVLRHFKEKNPGIAIDKVEQFFDTSVIDSEEKRQMLRVAISDAILENPSAMNGLLSRVPRTLAVMDK